MVLQLASPGAASSSQVARDPGRGRSLAANSTNASAIEIVDLPIEIVDLPIENSGFTHWKWWIYPLKMVIFHSYVNLPEGIHNYSSGQITMWLVVLTILKNI